jgi:hypothetical protein
MSDLFPSNIYALGSRATRRAPSVAISPEEESSLMRTLYENTGGAIEFLGKVLDTPAAIGRGAMADQPLSEFGWGNENRISGEELLLNKGALKPTDPAWLKTAAGFATEIATDPLLWVSGPLKALGAGGKAARAAGILDKAPDAALAAKGIAAASADSLTGRATSAWAKRLANDGLAATPETFSIRPLIGPRVAQNTTTLDDLVKFVDNGKPSRDAYNDVLNYLSKQGLRYDDVAYDTLGGTLGVGGGSVKIPGMLPALDALDYAGQKLAWNPVTRRMSQMFDGRVDDMYGAADQVEALKHSKYVEDALKDGRRTAARHAMTVSNIKLPPNAAAVLGSNTLLSEQGNNLLTRLFENTATASDRQLQRMIGPQLDDAIASWDAIRKNNVNLGTLLGMEVDNYSDLHHVLYSPRRASEADFEEYGSGLSRSLFNTRTLEQKARQEYLKTPGGTMDLREVSLLPIVDEFTRSGPSSKSTIGQVGKAIADYINAKHAPGSAAGKANRPATQYLIGQDQGEKIASFLQRMDKRRPAGLPIFSEHPITAQARSAVGQGVSRANARFVYDTLAEHAVEASRSGLAGNYRGMDVALSDVARATGLRMDDGIADPLVQMNLAQAIGKRLGKPASAIDLSQYSVSEQVTNRLLRIQSFYSSPRAQQEILDSLDSFTNLWKGFILAWPSRFVRDMYSNVFSQWLENGSVRDTVFGNSLAKHLLRGEYDKAYPLLQQLPKYSHLPTSDAIRQAFTEDAAAAGVLQTLATSDLLSSSRSGNISQLVPGATPISRRAALSELGGNWGNFFQIKDTRFPWQSQSAYETLNPVLNASQKMSDFVDSVGRLGGYISLLRQGVAPNMAAERITRALVDYSSLTTLERNVFRRVFPWWAYNSRIGKYVVQHMAEQPGGLYGQTIRGMNTLQASNEDVYLPTAIRQQFGVRIPDELKPYLGISDIEGGETVLKNIDAAGVDVLSLFAPSWNWGEAASDTISNFAGQMTPMLKTPMEWAFDTDLFSKRPLNEAKTPLDKLYMAASNSPVPMNKYARGVINSIPGLQRPISLFAGIATEELPFWEALSKQAINQVSGMSRADIEEPWIVNDLRRENARGLGKWTRTRTTKYVPEELMPFVPQGLLPRVALDKKLEKRAGELYRQKLEKQANATP